jgi:hypothetical protein
MWGTRLEVWEDCGYGAVCRGFAGFWFGVVGLGFGVVGCGFWVAEYEMGERGWAARV